MKISKVFKFDAAHNLIKYHGKCESLHGHTYKLVVTMEGKLNEEGMIIDFACFKKIVEDNVLNLLDHSYLNNIIEQPTAENIALWIWEKLQEEMKTRGLKLIEVQVWETADNYVSYNGV